MKNLNFNFKLIPFKTCITFVFTFFVFLGITKASENSFLHLGLDLDYKTGASVTNDQNTKVILDVAQLLTKSQEVKVMIFGFSDLTGNTTKDKKIAVLRAENIKKELVSSGVAAQRISTGSLAEYDSIIKNKKVFDQKQNRKIVLKVLDRDINKITEIINWSKTKKQISVVDPLGTKIKNLTLLTEMLRSQNSDSLIPDKNSGRIPASK